MKNKKLRRVADPLWVLCCQWWDRLTEGEKKQVVQAMRLLVEKRLKGEGLSAADIPPEERSA